MVARKKTAGADRSRRDRLLARPRPSLPYPIRVRDPARARQELQRVEQEARQVLIRDGRDSDAYRAEQVKVDAARAVVDGCYETVTVTALNPADYEALKGQHPPTEAQQAEPDPADVNVDSFVPAVLAAGSDAGMSVDDWAAFLAENCSDGERQELRVLVLGLNERSRFADAVVLPKGWTGMLSSL